MMIRFKTKTTVLYGFIVCMLIIIFTVNRGHLSIILTRNDKNDRMKSLEEFSCDSDLKFPKPQDEDSDFPKHIHQLFFYETDNVIPERLESARKTWINDKSDFRYTLWNATMIENLISTKYPSLMKTYVGYTHWVRRADMARYLVLYEHGGMYIDIDIKSKSKDLRDLYSRLKNTSGIVLYVSQPAFVSNDFMIAKPKHSFMKSVLCGLADADRWYVLPYITTMMSTGPLYLHYKFKQHAVKNDIEIIPSSELSEFITHISGSSWHQWDGKIIWWIFVHLTLVSYVCLTILCVVICFLLLRKYRRMITWIDNLCWGKYCART